MSKHRGAGTLEYALIRASMFMAIYVAVNRMGSNVSSSFSNTSNVTATKTNAAAASVVSGSGGIPKGG